MMDTREAIGIAREHLLSLVGQELPVLAVNKPTSPDTAVNLSKCVSKLSPLVGNMIEFTTVDYLNGIEEFNPLGKWIRQDPGFPDTLFVGDISPAPGFEVKAWFPLATEITARFKDSQNVFAADQTYVAVLAWLPSELIFGVPVIIGVDFVSALAVAKARDNSYFKPPRYLVVEPRDTTSRTRNLQQSNTSGHRFQGTDAQLVEAQAFVDSWGETGKAYHPGPELQELIHELQNRFPYRNDTNFAKMDRVFNDQLKLFKKAVLSTEFHGKTIGEWGRLLKRGNEDQVKKALAETFGIREVDPADLYQLDV